MPNQILELHEVKTRADANKYLTDECVSSGLLASLYSYVFGIVAFPLAARRWGRQIRYMNEYKLALGATSMMLVSYYIGVYTKSKCEERVKKELHDLFLEK